MRRELDHQRAREHLPRARRQLEQLRLLAEALGALPVPLLQPHDLAQVQGVDLLQRILFEKLGPIRGRDQAHLGFHRADASGDRMTNDLERGELLRSSSCSSDS